MSPEVVDALQIIIPTLTLGGVGALRGFIREEVRQAVEPLKKEIDELREEFEEHLKEAHHGV